MKVEHQLRSFDQIQHVYDGKLPLHRFLPAYFKQHKQMGSSDRRWATRYLYSFYRLGKALPRQERNTRIAVGDFLCNATSSLIVETYLPAFIVKMDLILEEKLQLVQQAFPDFFLNDVFPWSEKLSEGIDREAFQKAHFVQPKLFIRTSEKVTQRIETRLLEEGVAVKVIDAQTLSIPNGTKLESMLPADLVYRVQDLSSQYTRNYFDPEKYSYWWDCCAASGGKSLLLYELEPTIQLLVSDLRESVLQNLDERFQKEGIRKYQKKALDLLKNNDQILHDYFFDGIILDAPCSGSGTWGRTPESIAYFDKSRIEMFAQLQRNIAANIVKHLKTGKPLIYITCSVLKAENEDTVAFMTENLPLRLEKMEVIKGYKQEADTMFVARLIKIDP